MKKLPIVLKTPARVVIAVGLIVLVAEFLIMVVIETLRATILKDNFMGNVFWEFVDPIVLTAIVSPALYLLIFRPLNQQADLERQLDELRRFQKVTVGRELRMKELMEEIAALRNPPSAEQASDVPVASGSLEAPLHAAEQDVSTQLTEESHRNALLFLLEDLEGARKKVVRAHHEWTSALDAIEDPIFLHDREFRVLRCNKAYQQHAGIKFMEIIGQPYYEVFPKTQFPLPSCLRVMEKAAPAADEEEIVIGDATFRLRIFSVYDKRGDYLHSVHIFEDITERKRASQALLERERLYRSLFENMLNGFAYCQMIFEQDQPQDFIYLSVNAAFETQTGLKNVVGKRVSEVIPGVRQSDPKLFEIYGRVSLSGKPERFEIYVDALKQWFLISVYSPEKGYFVAVFDVITERKRAEKALFEKTQLLDSVIENMPNMVFLKSTPDLRFELLNRAGEALLGHGRDDLLGRNDYDFFPKEQADFFTSKDRATLLGNDITDIPEELIETPRGTRILHTKKLALCDVQGQPRHLLGISEDITERKRAEIAIQHANRALATLSAVNSILVHATVEGDLLLAICQAIVQQRGYQLAWVGYVEHDESKSIKIMAHAGQDRGYLDTMRLTWAASERGMGPSGRAVRSGTTQLCKDMANDPHYSPWRDEALKRGYASSIALPLTDGDGKKVFGILNVYANEVNAFSPKEVDLLEEMASDLSFGVRNLHIRHERDLALVKNQEQLMQLRDSLEDTVRAIALTVEMRDPYTAGHQRQVADLARAIGTQMGLPEEQVHGIHLAGVVHDLGKVNIPSEILSKPGKISQMEFGLIKTHPQAGYDILKDINFPWPIALMVLQHHERFDGSGYPQGLKGDAILLEARILCVADVVEAMSSHRPYRPGLGIDVALAEITKKRGASYDPAVVDACLVLFREKHYSFKS